MGDASMRHHQELLFSLSLVALLVLTGGGADAATVAHPAPATAADRLADLHARRDVARALAALPAGGRKEALGRLEGAEIALLNRQSYDLGPLLRTDRPVPTTSAIAELDQARVDVLHADVRRARAAAAAAHHTVGVELGAVSRVANRGGSLAQAGKETTP